MTENNKEQEGSLLVDEPKPKDADAALEFSGDDQDGEAENKADQAMEALVGILEHMGLDAEVLIRQDDEEIILDLQGPDAGRAIGKKGQTLDALQFLVNKIVNRSGQGRRHIILDSGDYRQRHDESLVSRAKREARRAMDRGRVVTLEPMSARDRRVIHLSLAEVQGVTTRSDGEGMDRRIQIIPARGPRNTDSQHPSHERQAPDAQPTGVRSTDELI